MKTAIITVDLGLGDAGKGTVVDHLCRQLGCGLVVRYNGGAQCAHHVMHGEMQHTFAQFGSGALSGAHTFLSEHVLFNPLALECEALVLEELRVLHGIQPGHIYIDARANVTTPYHRALNRLRELARGKARHGSCGMGVGETVWDYLNHDQSIITAGHLERPGELMALLCDIKGRLHEQVHKLNLDKGDLAVVKELSTFKVPTESVAEKMANAVSGCFILDTMRSYELLSSYPLVVFEGAQGVLLDQDYGFHPYTTWSSTTTKNALAICADFVGVKTLTLGITRTYGIRHGPGPFPTADAKADSVLKELHNGFNLWQREFRRGWMDLMLLSYGAELANIDALTITHVDTLSKMVNWPVATYYRDWPARFPHPMGQLQQEQLTASLFKAWPLYQQIPADRVTTVMAERLQKPVMITSHGPYSHQKEMLGAWPA